MKLFALSDNPQEQVKSSAPEGTSEIPSIPSVLPILPLKNTVVYPIPILLPLIVGQPRSVRLVDDVVVGDRLVGLVALKDPNKEEPGPDDMYHVGSVAVINRYAKAPDGTIRLFIQGIERIRLTEFVQSEPYFKARIEVIPDRAEEGVEVEALMRNAVELFRRMAQLMPYMPEELTMATLSITDPRQLVYLLASYVRMEMNDAQQILEMDSVKAKLEKLTGVMNRELEVLELGKKIQERAQSELEKAQREYILREQMKAIQKELGEADEQQAEINELRRRIEEAGMPPEADKEARRELDRLSKMPPAAAEYSVIKTYLDWLVSLPWNKSTPDNLDINRARQVLDEDHYNLEKIKDRILEYLAVRKLKKERLAVEGETVEEDVREDYIRRQREGVILCFVGPPGTGKTSLGLSIARALGRKFVRQSLGGMRDEAEIRGHRRTYIGAMPGRIIQALKRVESKNPVFMLDEVDKIGTDWRGDPSSALLEVLDPEQNREFRDHYLDVPFDLSEVMFICTANLLDPIPPALRDRMEILQLSGYTEEEKIKIAQGYLIPRQRKENVLKESEIEFTVEALRKIIRDYTREAGVRNLERQIGAICRKVATKIAAGEIQEKVIVTPELVAEYLGRPRFFFEAAERTEIPGVATGLAWTETGGDILFVEATKMPGKKAFTITGQLGDVMKESAEAALSYVRSKAETLGIDKTFFEHNDLHLHIPAGAIPKDGPSAGVTMATALVSLLSNRPVRSDVGMTGEITLRGQVLPVGGVKEKVLAARRAGLTTVILPKRNAPDLEELPEDIRKEMNFVLVDTVDEVLAAALTDGTGPKAQSKRASRSKSAKRQT
ncbi:MAG: endopeptidase La [Chloroflexi bacterium]|nr:endopeptidase La [Chloroflexota bacterium]